MGIDIPECRLQRSHNFPQTQEVIPANSEDVWLVIQHDGFVGPGMIEYGPERADKLFGEFFFYVLRLPLQPAPDGIAARFLMRRPHVAL